MAADGTVYVSDGSDTICRIDPVTGNLSTFVGLGTPSVTAFGDYHATDLADNVFVAVRTASYPDEYAIQRIAPDGMATTPAPGGLNGPRGMATDRAGNLYVVDVPREDSYTCLRCGFTTAMRKITPQDVVSTVVGQKGVRGIALRPLPASLSAPTDVSFDGAGNLLIGSKHAVLKVQLEN